MHKKLASELDSLAHDILKMKNKNNVFALKEKAQKVYDKLSVLAYIEEYINTTPQANQTKEELIDSFKNAELKHKNKINQEKKIEETSEKENIENKKIELENKTEALNVNNQNTLQEQTANNEFKVETPREIEQPFEELESILFDDPKIKNEADFIEQKKSITLEEELEDTLPVDVMADLFTKPEQKISLNDRLNQTLQIGLNDRIAFVNHLFDGNQQDFNRVLSQLNTIETEKEAKHFIKKIVKPEHDWSDKEAYEERFMEIIERKFI